MKYTNNHSLPEAVFNLITKDNYDPGESDYSVTTLLRPPQQVQLERRHYDELETDACDHVWSLFGSVAHDLLDRHGSEDSLREKRLYVEVLGRKVGGQVDNYHNGTVSDYKITSSWTLVYGSRLHEWTEQLNLYAYIFRQNGYEVNKLQIITILRDWDKNKAKQDHKYPQVPIVIIPLELWSEEEAQEFITYRVARMIEAETEPDHLLNYCSSEEMWEQAPKYAVMKEGRKTAVRVFDTEEEANQFLQVEILDHRPEQECYYSVVTRQGKRTRCEDGYCSAAKFCCQFKKYKEEQNGSC